MDVTDITSTINSPACKKPRYIETTISANSSHHPLFTATQSTEDSILLAMDETDEPVHDVSGPADPHETGLVKIPIHGSIPTPPGNESLSDVDMDVITASEDIIRIVLIGKTGVGKSSLGNSLSGRCSFVVGDGPASVTADCKPTAGFLKCISSKLKIIDTPGLCDTNKSNEETADKIIDCMELSLPGPHIFLYIISMASRFTPEDQDSVNYFQRIFGDETNNFTIVVFTNIDSQNDHSYDTWLQNALISPLIEKYQHRYCFINNRSDDSSKQSDVTTILSLIKKTIQNNDNRHYTVNMFTVAKTMYKKFLEDHREEQKSAQKLRTENQELKDKTKLMESEYEEMRIKLKRYDELESEISKLKLRLERYGEPVDERPEIKVMKTGSISNDVTPMPATDTDDVTSMPATDTDDVTSMDITCTNFSLNSYVFRQGFRNSMKSRRKRSRGKMPDPGYSTIQHNFITLLDNIDPNKLAEALFESVVFDEEDVDVLQVHARYGTKNVNRKLLIRLLNCGDVYYIFVQCLTNTGHDAAIQILTSENFNDTYNINPDGPPTASREIRSIEPVPNTDSQQIRTIEPVPNTDSQQMRAIEPAATETTYPLDSYVFKHQFINRYKSKSQRQRGKMPEEDYGRIRKNFTFLQDNLNPDILSQSLFENVVFDEDDLDCISNFEPKTRHAIAGELLRRLLNCGDVYKIFVTCLTETGHHHIVRQLEPETMSTGITAVAKNIISAAAKNIISAAVNTIGAKTNMTPEGRTDSEETMSTGITAVAKNIISAAANTIGAKTNMTPEGRTDSEARDVLMEIDTCIKKDSHPKFIKLPSFKMEDIPVIHRYQLVFDYIKEFAKRVVLVEAVGESVMKGSGILFRADNIYCVQTNTLVTASSQKVNTIFNFDVDGEMTSLPNRQLSKLGDWPCQDKSLYFVPNVPADLQNITDIGPLVVDVQIGNKRIKGLVEYCNYSKQYIVHVSKCATSITRDTQCRIIFNSDDTHSVFVDVETCPKGCYKLYVNQGDIPKAAKDLFNRKCPWKLSNNPLVVVISHPHGKAKRLSFGSRLSFASTREHDTPYGDMFHDAPTCGGSTGGGVLLIGEDTTQVIGYNSHLGMHQGPTEDHHNTSTIGLIDVLGEDN